MTTDDLVKLAEAYGSHHGLTLSTVSTYAANDGKWIVALKAGTAGCTLRKANSAVRWFDTNWPSDLEWPLTITRPSQSKEAA